MRLVENTVVAGRFRLNHVLGRGGMGAVWHATHLGLDIPCAIKFVKGELADQEDIKQRFEREAKAAAHLRSPHVVQILDHGVCEGTPYIAMELLDGEDLGARLQKRGRLTPEELHKVMSEACRALAKAHAQGIVHRDLKPDNIFLVKDDDREITKVLDFGIAKTVTNELGGSGTKTGAMLGTPYYMSPEQAQGTKTVDFRSDLWSLAVIAYQCLTGALPFESEALGDLLVKIIISPVPVPSQIAPVPAGFDKWWAKAASRDPADRYQSAKEFSDNLALVCGVSHVSGVIDRSQLRVVAEKEAAGQPVPTDAATTTKSAPARPPLPSAPDGVATTPGNPPQMTAPAVAPAVVPAGAGPATQASGPNAVTPTPLSRSFVDEPPPKPPTTRIGLVLVFALGGLLFASTLGTVGWYLFEHGARSSATTSAAASASGAPSASASTGAAPSATAAASTNQAPPVQTAGTEATATATAQPADTTAPAAPDNGNSPTPTSAGTTSNNSGGGGATSSHGKPSKPSSGGTTPSKPKPGKPADMGF
jgi:serine/threonine protein kinase